MSADGSIVLDWAGEPRKFRLAIGQLRELQEHVNRWRVAIGGKEIGPRALARLIADGDAWPDDIREIIRLGLIGGGTPINRVPMLIKRYVEDRPLLESAEVAHGILLRALVGAPEDVVGQKKTAETETTATASFDSQTSTEPDAQSDTHQSKSTECRSGNLPPVLMDGIEPMAQKTSLML